MSEPEPDLIEKLPIVLYDANGNRIIRSREIGFVRESDKEDDDA